MKFNNERKENTKSKFINIKVRRSYTVAESKKAVLFHFETDNFEGFYVWINKIAIFASNFTDILDVSLIDNNDFMYSVYKEGNNDWSKPDGKVSGKELKAEILKDFAIQEINII